MLGQALHPLLHIAQDQPQRAAHAVGTSGRKLHADAFGRSEALLAGLCRHGDDVIHHSTRQVCQVDDRTLHRGHVVAVHVACPGHIAQAHEHCTVDPATAVMRDEDRPSRRNRLQTPGPQHGVMAEDSVRARCQEHPVGNCLVAHRAAVREVDTAVQSLPLPTLAARTDCPRGEPGLERLLHTDHTVLATGNSLPTHRPTVADSDPTVVACPQGARVRPPSLSLGLDAGISWVILAHQSNSQLPHQPPSCLVRNGPVLRTRLRGPSALWFTSRVMNQRRSVHVRGS